MTQMQQFDGTEHITMYNEPERTSIAAILGLVLGCIGCCGGITAIPGVFLSIFGIVGIVRAKGRIGGMGFAIAGLLVGLLTLALWGGVVGASIFGLNWVEKSAAAPTAEVLRDIESGDYVAARASLGLPAAGVSDEMFIEFTEGYLGGLGPVVSETQGVMDMITGYGAVGEQIQRYNGRPNYIPMPMKFGNGIGLVVIEIDPTTANSGSFAPIRIIVVGVDGNESVLPPWDWVNPNPNPNPDADADAVLPGVEIEDFTGDDAEEPADEPADVPVDGP